MKLKRGPRNAEPVAESASGRAVALRLSDPTGWKIGGVRRLIVSYAQPGTTRAQFARELRALADSIEGIEGKRRAGVA